MGLRVLTFCTYRTSGHYSNQDSFHATKFVKAMKGDGVSGWAEWCRCRSGDLGGDWTLGTLVLCSGLVWGDGSTLHAETSGRVGTDPRE